MSATVCCLSSHELPDHLPLYLEYLAQLPEEEALGGLRDVAPILGLLSARLQQRESRYAVLFRAVTEAGYYSGRQPEGGGEDCRRGARRYAAGAGRGLGEKNRSNSLPTRAAASREISAHQRRFAGAVAPQYLNISNGGQQ